MTTTVFLALLYAVPLILNLVMFVYCIFKLPNLIKTRFDAILAFGLSVVPLVNILSMCVFIDSIMEHHGIKKVISKWLDTEIRK